MNLHREPLDLNTHNPTTLISSDSRSRSDSPALCPRRFRRWIEAGEQNPSRLQLLVSEPVSGLNRRVLDQCTNSTRQPGDVGCRRKLALHDSLGHASAETDERLVAFRSTRSLTPMPRPLRLRSGTLTRCEPGSCDRTRSGGRTPGPHPAAPATAPARSRPAASAADLRAPPAARPRPSSEW